LRAHGGVDPGGEQPGAAAFVEAGGGTLANAPRSSGCAAGTLAARLMMIASCAFTMENVISIASPDRSRRTVLGDCRTARISSGFNNSAASACTLGGCTDHDSQLVAVGLA